MKRDLGCSLGKISLLAEKRGGIYVLTISALFREQDGWALLGAKNSKCQTCTCVCNTGRPEAGGGTPNPLPFQFNSNPSWWTKSCKMHG